MEYLDIRDQYGFMAGLRKMQSPAGRGYLPPEVILTESLREALERDRELRRIFGREFTFVDDLTGLACPELGEMMGNAIYAGIIEPIFDMSSPGYFYLIQQRGAGILLRESNCPLEIEKLAVAVHEAFLPAVQKHIDFFEKQKGRTSYNLNLEHALRIRSKLREVCRAA